MSGGCSSTLGSQLGGLCCGGPVAEAGFFGGNLKAGRLRHSVWGGVYISRSLRKMTIVLR